MSIILSNRPFGTGEHREASPILSPDETYNRFIQHIYENGVDKTTERTGVGTRSICGYTMRFNLQQSLALIGSKRVYAKNVFDELKFFLEGSTNNNRLREINQKNSKLDWSQRDTIWQEWADPVTGELGPIYSQQWRNFRGDAIRVACEGTQFEVRDEKNFYPIVDKSSVVYAGIDQIEEVRKLLMNSPDSRRIIVNAWNPSQTHEMALPPCHTLFQFYSRLATWEERRAELHRLWSHIGHDAELTHEYFDEFDIPRRVLCLILYMRSVDSVLGAPYNLLSYSMLGNMMAQQVNMIPGDFVWNGADCHIYANHFEGIREQMARPIIKQNPQMRFRNKPASLYDYEWTDFEITDYNPHPSIDYAVAV